MTRIKKDMYRRVSVKCLVMLPRYFIYTTISLKGNPQH